MLAAAFGLGAALCWGFGDFLGGLRSRRLTLAFVLLVSQLTGLAVVAIIVAVGGFESPTFSELLPAAAAGAGGLVALAALYRALATGTMSVISPISASGAAMIPVVFGLASGEEPSALQFAGIVAALIGVILATRSAGGPASSGNSRQSLWLAAVAAVGFGAFFVGMDTSVEDAGPFWALMAARCGATAMLGISLLALRPRLDAKRAEIPALALIGLLDVGANACFALGTDTGLLSVVAVLASLYPTATVVLAQVVLGERLVRVQAVGVIIALAGVVLLAAG